MNDIDTICKTEYIYADKLSQINDINKQYIIKNWSYVKNVNTNQEYYIIPSDEKTKNNMRFELLKVACEYKPETFEEKLFRELNEN
tara:strand:- start:1641 stop:1898 length:258 start_codon:yes stop_codon:yes gene_type:complete